MGKERDWRPFVENRVKEIRELIPISSWRHCPGKDNPADIPSRGTRPKELMENPLWFKGPHWLIESERERYLPGEMPAECVRELRCKREVGYKTLGLLVSHLSNVIDVHTYSNVYSLLKVTALVLRFVTILRVSVSVSREKESSLRMIDLMRRAEIVWIKAVQASFTREEKFKEWKHQLQIFEDQEGILRCGGRLENAAIPYDTKHPVILSSDHYFTELIILRAHERVFHNGMKETLTEVRSKYWIVRGRAIVKKIIKRCVVCRKAEGLCYDVPVPPPLPIFRVTEKPAFTYMGVDLAGPLYVKRSECELSGKVWVCVFTCCVTRAIHLDILFKMSLEFFIRCFRRFVARRGLPQLVVSDNAKTFKSAAQLFQKIMSHPESSHYLQRNEIQWKFNVEKAPWWGGFFERLIRSIKRCTRKIIGRASLTREELLTVITEIEMIVNSRPLSYVSQSDLDEPITPSHLLIGRRILSLPDRLCHSEETEDEEYQVTPQILNKRVTYLNHTIDQFWNRWRGEYLLELREAHRLRKRYSQTGRTIQSGDIVVVHSDERRRGFWNLGKVEDMHIGEDGEIRGATVRVYTGNKRSKLLRRPIQKLFPLEVNEEERNAVTEMHRRRIMMKQILVMILRKLMSPLWKLMMISQYRKLKTIKKLKVLNRIMIHSIQWRGATLHKFQFVPRERQPLLLEIAYWYSH